MIHDILCPECGIPLVPFGGEDVCMQSCDECGAHECDCDRDDVRWCGECGGDETECSCP